MVARLTAYMLIAFVLVTSWGFTCPDFYMSSELSQHANLGEKKSDEDCCGDMDHQQSNRTHYGAFHDRIWYPPNLSSYGLHAPQLLAIESSVLRDVAFSSASSIGLAQSPPNPTPGLLSKVVMRI